MREIILTGYGRKEVRKVKGRVHPRCYLCKRQQGDRWVYTVPENGGYKNSSTEMGFEWVEIIKDDISSSSKGANTKFRYYVCYECMILMEAIADRFQFAQILSKEQAK